MRLVPATAIFVVACAWLLGACKPDRVDVHAQRHEAATTKAQQARQAIQATQGEQAATESGEAAPVGHALATIGERTITVGTLDAHIATMPRHMQGRYSTAEDRLRLLQEMVNFEVLAREAQRLNLDRSPEVQQAVKLALVEQLLKTKTSEGMRATDITTEAIADYYRGHASTFVTPEYRRAAILVIREREGLEAVLTTVRQAIGESPQLARQVFGDFAAEKSEDSNTVERRGDLGRFDLDGASEEGRQVCLPLYATKAFSLGRVGDITPPFKLEDGRWASLQLTGKTSSTTRSLEDARLDIQRALLASSRAQRVDDYIAGLRAEAEITIDERALKTLAPAAKPADPTAPEPPVKEAADPEPRPQLNPRAVRQHMMPSGPRGDDVIPIRKTSGLKLSDQEVQEKMRKREKQAREEAEREEASPP